MSTRDQAIELLAILASQERWAYDIYNLPGYSYVARDLARNAIRPDQCFNWQERYADGEAVLQCIAALEACGL